MTTTIRGRLTADPELRFTASGAAVANLTIAEYIRGKNASGQWSVASPHRNRKRYHRASARRDWRRGGRGGEGGGGVT